MIYLIGNKSTEELVKQTASYSSAPPISQIMNAVSAETGIPVSGLHSYGVKDAASIDRLLANDSYELVWNDVYWETPGVSGVIEASGYNREIVDVDFSTEDNKRQVVFIAVEPTDESTRKAEIVNDGIDTARILVQVYLPDMTAIDTSYNNELKIPFKDPDSRVAYAKVTVTNGTGYKDFKTTKYGSWTILNKHTFPDKNAKVHNGYIYDIDVLMNI